MPGIHNILVPIVITCTAVTPGIVDHIRSHAGVGVCTGHSCWGSNELGAGEQGGVGAAAGTAAAASHPLRARGDANLVGAAVIANHGTHGMRSMAIGIRRHSVVAIRIEPVVIVRERTAIVASVLVHQGLVGVAHASIDAGNDQTLAGVPECPSIWSQNMRDVGFNTLPAHIDKL